MPHNPSTFILAILLLMTMACSPSQKAATAQQEDRPKTIDMTKNPRLSDVGRNAYILVDDREFTLPEFLKTFRPEEIAVIKPMRKEEAFNKYGVKAADGAVIMISRTRAKYQNQEKLSKQSSKYAELLEQGLSDADFLYVLNDKPLFQKIDAQLYDIPAESIRKVRIKGASFVSRKYQQSQKWAVLISTR